MTLKQTLIRTKENTRHRIAAGIAQAVGRLARWLTRHSIGLLRISLGLVFLGFGVLKFFPGSSPAEPLVVPTVEVLTFGVVSGTAALVMTAAVECFIGITLLTGRLLKTGLLVLSAALVGIMSPLVLFFSELFHFNGTPSLEAQYVLKNIVLIAAAMVVTARALGSRLVCDPKKRPDAADLAA